MDTGRIYSKPMLFLQLKGLFGYARLLEPSAVVIAATLPVILLTILLLQHKRKIALLAANLF